MNSAQLARYAHTIRYLKPSQIWGRVWFKLNRPSPDLSPPPATRPSAQRWQSSYEKVASMAGPSTVTFLNQSADISGPAVWQDSGYPLLWLYNLHYFDDLVAAGAPDRQAWHSALIQRWIRENPPAIGVGWQPYPSSLRIVNWIKWSLAGNALNGAALSSLAVQVRYLRQRLEYHILGNHLLANAKALYFAGAFFDGSEAEGWLALASRLLKRQVAEQVLGDGAHFELSPMYHLIVLEDLLDIINISRAQAVSLPDGMEAVASSMLAWSQTMRHPDGEIPFFNDATIGIAAHPAGLDDYGQRLGIGPAPTLAPESTLNLSGYARLETKRATLFADAAAVGPPYLPGHAHADTLSFELSIDGQRVVVNGGTSVYGTDAERHRQRGTAAHSTLTIDGLNSSDVWAGFRVGRRASPANRVLNRLDSGFVLEASHDGYRHLPGAPIHERRWSLREQELLVTDQVRGTGAHGLISTYHLHPAVEAAEAPGGFVLRIGGRDIRVAVSPDCHSELVASSWHPAFGVSIQSRAIRVSRQARLPATVSVSFNWAA